jgi:hypothetical protein
VFCFDVETLGTESRSVVLSFGVIHFDLNLDFTYQDLINNSLFVKFNAAEQIEKYKRTYSKSTLNWWNSQPDIVKKSALVKSNQDVSMLEGINALRNYSLKHDSKNNSIVWARGSMDGGCLESMCTDLNVDQVFEYYRFRDVRTAVDILKDTASRGYCEIPDFDKDIVLKHHPVHDVAYDIMMLKYGK